MKPRLIEYLNFRVPEGFHATLRAAAERRGVKIGEFLREVVAKALHEPPNGNGVQ